MEDSLQVELNALRQKVTANEEAVSVLTTAQDDHEARITALESASATHIRRLRHQQLRIEDSENRSRRDNIRLQGLPEATSGAKLKPTVISILNKVLGREAATPIELDRVHRTHRAAVVSWQVVHLQFLIPGCGDSEHKETSPRESGMELLFVLGLIGAEIVTVISDEPAPTNSSNALQAALPVPLWVIVLVCGLIGFVILVASVALIVCLIQRSKQKKQEQRDKGSIWINEDMAKDWTLSRNNKVFPMVSSPESTAETEMSHPYLTYKNSYTYHGSVQPFSSFRT
ncbi:protein HIDE1 [Aquarana catesbeiana]|uniref:protein HIDE1 n=1 Tax=Aquarana catesbeiana TaxID=8400 RepID=UPI003CC9C29E